MNSYIYSFKTGYKSSKQVSKLLVYFLFLISVIPRASLKLQTENFWKNCEKTRQTFSHFDSLFKPNSASPAVCGKYPNNKVAYLKDSDFMVGVERLELPTSSV